MKLFNIFKRKEKSFEPTNALEIQIVRRMHEIQPQSFFELLSTRDLILALRTKMDGRNNIEPFIVPRSPDFSFVIAFTSIEAYEYALEKFKFGEGHFVGMKGRDLLTFLHDNKLNMALNFGVYDIPVFEPDNIRFILEQLDSPHEIVTERIDIQSPQKIDLGLPKNIPHQSLAAIEQYLIENPAISKIHFSLMLADNPQTGQKELSHLLVVEPSRYCSDEEFAAINVRISDLWLDAQTGVLRDQNLKVSVMRLNPDSDWPIDNPKIFLKVSRPEAS